MKNILNKNLFISFILIWLGSTAVLTVYHYTIELIWGAIAWNTTLALAPDTKTIIGEVTASLIWGIIITLIITYVNGKKLKKQQPNYQEEMIKSKVIFFIMTFISVSILVYTYEAIIISNSAAMLSLMLNDVEVTGNWFTFLLLIGAAISSVIILYLMFSKNYYKNQENSSDTECHKKSFSEWLSKNLIVSFILLWIGASILFAIMNFIVLSTYRIGSVGEGYFVSGVIITLIITYINVGKLKQKSYDKISVGSIIMSFIMKLISITVLLYTCVILLRNSNILDYNMIGFIFLLGAATASVIMLYVILRKKYNPQCETNEVNNLITENKATGESEVHKFTASEVENSAENVHKAEEKTNMNKFCPKCYAELKENTNFCSRCGNKIKPY